MKKVDRTQVHLRLEKDLANHAKTAATFYGLTLSGYINYAIRRTLESDENVKTLHHTTETESFL